MKHHRMVHGCACFLLGIALAPSARAQPPVQQQAREEGDRDARRKADALFTKGSALFQQWQFVHAEEKYREALTHWEHPAIYLYLGRTLEKQGHLESAYEALQQALERDPELLSREDHQVAEELRTSLESRLAQIEVRCAQDGAEVLLDGVPWFTAPDSQRKMVRPGQHVIIARKAGYFQVTEVATLLPGKQTRVELRMSVDEVRLERRWRPRTPWMVVGGGVATTLLGGLLVRSAMDDYAAVREDLNQCETYICLPVSTRRQDSGARNDAIGTGMLIAGSAAVVIGLAGVILNQPRSHRSEPASDVKLDFAPMVSGAGAGVSARIEF